MAVAVLRSETITAMAKQPSRPGGAWQMHTCAPFPEGLAADAQGPCERGNRPWMARATRSFPVPDSPSTRTLTSTAAIRLTCSERSPIKGLSPINPVSGKITPQAGFESRVLARQQMVVEDALDRDQQLVVVERLGHIVGRAAFHARRPKASTNNAAVQSKPGTGLAGAGGRFTGSSCLIAFNPTGLQAVRDFVGLIIVS